MAKHLEQTLQKLFISESDTIQQADMEVASILQDPACIPVLWQMLSTSSQSQIRRHAAVLLLSKVSETRQWNAVSAEIRDQIRQNILQVLISEPDKCVGDSLAMLVATIGKHELPSNRWPELFTFMKRYVQGNDAHHKEIGMLVLIELSSCDSEHLEPHMRPLLALCSTALDDPQNHYVTHTAIMTLKNVIPSIGTRHLKPYQDLIPKVMAGIKHLISADAELVVESLDMLNELTMCEVTMITPLFVKQIIQFALKVASTKEVDVTVRTTALSLVCTIVKQKKKAIGKQNLVPSILCAVFPILCDASTEVEAYEDEVVAKTPSSVAAKVIATMAVHFPSEKFFSALMKHVDHALQSQEPLTRRAAYHAIGAASDGCADCMRTKYLKRLLQSVYDGMNDPSAVVRAATMIAVEQLSDYLQPDINRFSLEFLPRLFDCLSKTLQDSGMRRKDITQMCHIMAKFCKNHGTDILPYLPQIMPLLMHAVRSAPLESKLLAVNAIGAIAANVAMEDLLPSFQDIIDLLKGFLTSAEDDELHKMLVCILSEHFCPIVADCIHLGINMMSSSEDPDSKQTSYGLFAAVSTILKQDMPEHLGVIVVCLLDSLQSTEGIKANYKNSKVEHALCDDLNEDEEEIDFSKVNVIDESDVASVEISNSYSQETEDALSAPGEPVTNTGHEHSEEKFKEVFELMEHPDFKIRKGAVVRAGEMCGDACKLAKDQPCANCAQVSLTMLGQTVPKLMLMAKEDDVREVVVAVLWTLKYLLKRAKMHTLNLIGDIRPLIGIIKDAFRGKLKCQDEEGNEHEGDSIAEPDSLLIKNAFKLLPTFAELIGGEEFAPFFAGLLPELIKKVKPSSSDTERYFSVGLLAETLHKMGDATSRFVRVLYNVFMDAVLDENDVLRSDAIYGLGVYASYGGPAVVPQYNDILQRLMETLNRETDRLAIDNICAAVCRMITSNADAIPLDQVLPKLVEHLPLQKDKEEHITVIMCLRVLYNERHPAIISILSRLIPVFNQMLRIGISAEVREIIVGWVGDISNCPDILKTILSSNPNYPNMNSLKNQTIIVRVIE